MTDIAPSEGFPPITSHDARVLILGSLPGAESLRKKQYYANRQNAFWRVMAEIIDVPADSEYARRCDGVRAHGLALWDVCHSAYRAGSLDARIDRKTIVANDFDAFLAAHRTIELIAFNGAAAAEIYRKKVLPGLPVTSLTLPMITLPSSSPAHARMSFTGKVSRWRDALT